MPSEHANIPPAPDDFMYVVEGTVSPPIEGDPEAALVTIQPDAEQARKRYEVHMSRLDRIVTGEIVVTPIAEHPDFELDAHGVPTEVDDGW